MANSAQARKRARQAEATRMRNASQKSALRTAVKKVKKAIATGDKAAASQDAAGIAGGDGQDGGQEDRPQEHGLAHQVAPVHGDQGIGVTPQSVVDKKKGACGRPFP